MNRKALSRISQWMKSKDFRIFLLFGVISITIWHVEKLRQTHTVRTDLYIQCVDVPDGYLTPTDHNLTMRANVQGVGFSLMKMELTNRKTVFISVNSLPRFSMGGQMWAVLTPNKRNARNTNLPGSLNITETLADTILIPLLTVHKKLLPVALNDHSAPKAQHLYSAPTDIRPDSVWVTGTNNIIDTMRYVWTEPQVAVELRDTLTRIMNLALPKNTIASSQDVVVRYFVEPFTEKKLDVPIEGRNLPDGYTAKTFPPHGTITFAVGLSQYDKIKATDFKLEANFEGISPGTSKPRVRISLSKQPLCTQNVTYSPRFAEYLLEKK